MASGTLSSQLVLNYIFVYTSIINEKSTVNCQLNFLAFYSPNDT